MYYRNSERRDNLKDEIRPISQVFSRKWDVFCTERLLKFRDLNLHPLVNQATTVLSPQLFERDREKHAFFARFWNDLQNLRVLWIAFIFISQFDGKPKYSC